MKRFILMVTFAGVFPAADTRVEAPVLGFMFDSKAGGTRAIQGIAGASSFSNVLDLYYFKAIWIAPGKHYALASGMDGQAYRLDIRTNAVSGVSQQAPQRIVWSSSGIAAALIYADGRLITLRTVSDTPETTLETNLAEGVSVLSVSDDGRVVLAVQPSGPGTDLLVIDESGSGRRVLTAPGLNTAAFLHGSHDAVVSDAVEGKIYLLRNSTELSITGRQEEASALAIAADNSRVFVASKTRRIVSTIRLSDGLTTPAECSCEPDVLDPLEGGVFRVTSLKDGPVWLFKPGEAVNSFTFVPSPVVRVE
jgi:hypothetical protein